MERVAEEEVEEEEEEDDHGAAEDVQEGVGRIAITVQKEGREEEIEDVPMAERELALEDLEVAGAGAVESEEEVVIKPKRKTAATTKATTRRTATTKKAVPASTTAAKRKSKATKKTAPVAVDANEDEEMVQAEAVSASPIIA